MEHEFHWCYLKDDEGILRSPLELPNSLSELKDDPYRSLAWMLEKCEAYVDSNIPFAEFLWADFLRERVRPWTNDKKGWKRAIKDALEWTHSEEASSLPGWIGHSKKCLSIVNKLK